MSKTREEARENVGVLDLLPWRDRYEWERYAKQQLSGHPDWQDHRWKPNRSALEICGQVFSQYEKIGGLDARLDSEWQKLLQRIRPTHKATGQGAGTGYEAVVSADPRQPALFRRVAQVIGRLQEAISARAIGSRYLRCGVCGQVYQLGRPPHEADYACSDVCREAQRQLGGRGEVPRARLPYHMISGLEWQKTDVQANATVPPANTTQCTNLPRTPNDGISGDR